MNVDRFSPDNAWIRRGARARLTVNLTDPVIPAGTIGIVRGTPDSHLKVPVNFGRNYGEPLVLMTEIEQA